MYIYGEIAGKEMKKLIIIICTMFIVTSCDYCYIYRYVITNDTESCIVVDLETYNESVKYVIEKHETKIIFETTHGVQGSGGPFFKDVSFDLEKCVVSSNDTISNKNYLHNSSWIFVNGKYETIVTDDEFNRVNTKNRSFYKVFGSMDLHSAPFAISNPAAAN